MSNGSIHTKFGSIKEYGGYYRIVSRIEGNHGKYFHRLLWEDFYGIDVPQGYFIHHKNGNKLDNCILNLQLMNSSEHSKHHSNDDNYGMKNRKHSKETKKRMSLALKGKQKSKQHRINLSKSRGCTGYYRVGIWWHNKSKRGWTYRYQYKDENNKLKSICSLDLDVLEKKVKERGLEWIKYGE